MPRKPNSAPVSLAISGCAMSAGRANRRLYRPPEGSLIETDRNGKRRVVRWQEIKRQIAAAEKAFWQKRPDHVRPPKLTLRNLIQNDVKQHKAAKSAKAAATPPAENR